jgi:hypothetical protein
MAEVGNAPLPPRSSNFQQSVQCLRDASVHPDEETIELPGPAHLRPKAPIYRATWLQIPARHRTIVATHRSRTIN